MAVKHYGDIQQRMEETMSASRSSSSDRSPLRLTSPSSLSDDDSVKESFGYAAIQRKMNETIMKGNIQHSNDKVSPPSKLIEQGVEDSSTASQSTQKGAPVQDSKNVSH